MKKLVILIFIIPFHSALAVKSKKSSNMFHFQLNREVVSQAEDKVHPSYQSLRNDVNSLPQHDPQNEKRLSTSSSNCLDDSGNSSMKNSNSKPPFPLKLSNLAVKQIINAINTHNKINVDININTHNLWFYRKKILHDTKFN